MNRLNRRSLLRKTLRGTGALVALPWLESFRVSGARAQTASLGGPQRFFGYYVPCGIRMDTWTPAQTGRNFAFNEAMTSLEPVKDYVLVLSQLENYAADDQGAGAGGHARGTATFLTATHPTKTGIRNGISLDQVCASVAGDTRLSSIELGAEAGRSAGSCDSGYACVYQQTISWASATTPLDKETNPRAAFDRLFGADALLTPEERALRRKQDKSVLDFVVGETAHLKPKLGARDRRKVDEYLTGVRELEQRLLTTADEETGICAAPARPDGATADNKEYVRQMLDLAALAFQCDVTRVATFMVANGGTGRAYTHLGLQAAHHELSHHQLIPGKLDGLLRINTWEVEELSYFLQRLASIEEPDANGEPANVLHNTVAVMGSEIADGDRHNIDDMPVLLAGRGGGFLDTGRHLRFPEQTPIANLYLTIAQQFGAPLSQFGDDGVAPLPEVLA